ncbi:MAG: TolC family protein [Chitinophagaceae bacterium]|nr:TolC family protein [Chitinophagaceae bacterium]
MDSSVSGVTGKVSAIKKLWLIILLLPGFLSAQQGSNDSILQNATLENVVRYAMQRNPALKNALLDQEITEAIIKSKLADWYPQLNFNYTLQHNFQLPTANFNGQFINIGLQNTSGAQFGLTQNVFNREVLLASRTARDVRLQSQQNTTNQKINIAVLVSKAFYDVLLTAQQLRVTEEDINRIDLSLKDAFYRYQSGITDKTDYKRATITLNNANAQKKNGEESLKAKYAYLKELMGYPAAQDVELQYDTAQLEKEIYIDTLQTITYNNRIEFQLLQTQKNLLQYNLKYNQWSFLPDVSLFGNYSLNYLNDNFSKIYNKSFPNSYAGLLLGIPIFQGGKRVQQVRQARFQLLQVDNTILDLQNKFNTAYVQALAAYKSNFYNYQSQQENVALAKEVYDIIQLQYRSGIKTYLEVINAETDLRTSQINFYNALYQVLSSKIEVQQSLGNIRY